MAAVPHAEAGEGQAPCAAAGLTLLDLMRLADSGRWRGVSPEVATGRAEVPAVV